MSRAINDQLTLGLLFSPRPRSQEMERTVPDISRPVLRGFVLTFWPVFAGSGLALLVVGAVLALAVNSLRDSARNQGSIALLPDAVPLPPKKPVDEPPLAVPAPTITVSVTPAADKPGGSLPAFPAASIKPASPLSKAADPNVPPDIDKALSIPFDLQPEDLPAAALDAPKCDTFGTAIRFVRSPAAASKQAQSEDRLVFTLHVSGNFEDPGFT